MARIIGNPVFKGWDDSGNDLSGGLLYTYVVSDTTPKATYPTIADAIAGTNANANPVVLNSRGEANVVINGSTKFVLKTSTGTTIWTVNNVADGLDVYDSNGNEEQTYSSVASAVNYVNILNSATGTGPSIRALGDDTNVDLLLVSKGTGKVKSDTLSAITTNGDLTLSGNGTGAVKIGGVKFPTADGTSGKVIKTDGAGTATWGTVTGSPGGSNTQMQYNSSGSLAGDSGFTTNGSGTVTLVGQFNMDNLRMDGNVLSATSGGLYFSKVPTFIATMSVDQSITNSTYTKVNFNQTSLDNMSWYDTTNKRYLPLIAGYYMFNYHTQIGTSGDGNWVESTFYKNGSAVAGAVSRLQTATAPINLIPINSAIIYCNGTTDYIEAWSMHTAGGTKTYASNNSVFSGYLLTTS